MIKKYNEMEEDLYKEIDKLSTCENEIDELKQKNKNLQTKTENLTLENNNILAQLKNLKEEYNNNENNMLILDEQVGLTELTKSYLDYITLLPNTDRPEAFGQHPNADITSLISESRMLFETLMSLQIQSTSSAAGSKEEKVAQLAADVLLKYNLLLNSINSSLEDLQKGIKGLVVMSTELEEIFTCIYEGRVPSAWLNAYPSLKLLGSWARDLSARVDHFTVWSETTHPPLFFWLAAYTFPTGFLTAVLQTCARAFEVPIDSLSWEFTVLTIDENQIQIPPENGVYVKSTFLEGAGWDKKNAVLIEPQPMQLVCSMPLIHFKPVEQLKKKTKGVYSCPCYYFPVRTGAANRPAFVVAVDLKSGIESADFWIKRGTALLLSLAN
ncbi:hypothetical protein NQ314_004503 [Rhamnusium bicolor]|uniref:Dynein heavy chain C-terminal domain-containing protein n=1 Tax=Rhamnusium bicolor TaxID=1586634 RepID=A0AAV8ZLQ9_9CUCU|nr:hypothetical protein NQ314_004503 [Rhamnusium bicolor]